MAKITFTRSNSANILTPSAGHASLFIDSSDGFIKVRNPDGTITSYGPSGAVSEANAYTDQKISQLVDSAPGLLDTLNELAAALGDDPNFATTITSQISSEAAARLAADNALDARLDVLEADPVTKTYVDTAIAGANVSIGQTRYVAKSGSDATGTGSLNKPFASITGALNSITDASPTNRYVIRVAAGTYNDAAIALKANVFIVGDMKNAVRLSGPVSLASDFSGSADNRSGISNAVVLGAVNFNWATVTSAAGKIFLNECIFSSTVTLYGHNSSIAQAQIQSCEFFGLFTVSGINVGIHSNNTHFADTVLNQHPNNGMATILTATGGKLGKITLTTTVNDFNRRCALFAFAGTYIDELKVDGASSYADLSESSVPRDPAKLTNPNNGNIVYLNSTVPYKTNDRNVGQPGRQYLYNFSYVHGSTESDLYLVSMGGQYSADSAGRSINIESDTFGLTSNVNGGDINLTTAETSGTGVRGKVKLTGREVDVNSSKVTNLANGTNANDAVNKSQLDLKQDSLGTGLISQFLRGDLSWSALASTDISDFASAVKAAAVADSITNGVTDVAPSQNAVFDALALKQDSLGTGTSDQYLRGDLTWHSEKYITTLSWSGTGPYTMSIPAATHGQGTDPSVDIRELDGSDWVDCVTVEVRINASGDITILTAESIPGKVVIK